HSKVACPVQWPATESALPRTVPCPGQCPTPKSALPRTVPYPGKCSAPDSGQNEMRGKKRRVTNLE
ncbi:hypothetical protein ACJMK2_016860, partial [Sinanodonta woodiana]